MLWAVLKRAIDVCHLLLLLLLLGILGTTAKVDVDTEFFNKKVELFQEDMSKMVAGHLEYVEGRVNRLQENQDGYQVSTHQRLKLLEGRVKALEAENRGLKSQSKNTNNILIQNAGNSVVTK